MLPDDYENLAQSAIASSVFANNILQCITTKNYWDIVNLYKPLMHMWYVGVLLQAYAVLPLIYMLLYKIVRKRAIAFGTVSITVLSLSMFLLPTFSSAWKFYYFPFRVFEISVGGLLIEWAPRASTKTKKLIGCSSLILLLFLLISRIEVVSGDIKLILTVFLSLIFLWATKELAFSKIIEIISVCFSQKKTKKILINTAFQRYIWYNGSAKKYQHFL